MKNALKWVQSRTTQVLLLIALFINGPVVFNWWSPNAEELAWAHSAPTLIFAVLFLAPKKVV